MTLSADPLILIDSQDRRSAADPVETEYLPDDRYLFSENANHGGLRLPASHRSPTA